MTKKKTNRRVFKERRLTEAEQHWNKAADDLLLHAEQIFELSKDFDTAVRDSIADGLARIVQAAFDCRANAQKFDTTEMWMAFIDSCTAQWFREHGFVEWFCAAAATGFRTTPPRTAVRNAFDWGGKPHLVKRRRRKT